MGIDFKGIREKLSNVKIKKEVLVKSRENLLKDLETLLASLGKYTYLNDLNVEQVKKDYADWSNFKIRIDNNTNLLGIKEKEYETKSKELLLVSKSFDFFSNVIDEVVAKYLKSLEDIVNVCYYEIYQNEQKSIKLDIVEKYNKKVLQLIVLNNGIEEKLVDSGGGVKVVLGTILLIYYVLWCDLPKIIFFDETYSGLDDITLENFFGVLKKFTEKGFKFIFISHDVRLLKYIDDVNIIEKGELK
jgi:ABC-type methionine transport system ATPase subunit